MAGTRFWSKVDRGLPNACWPWRGATRDGYGRFQDGGRLLTAHRVAYEDVNGVVPNGLELDHLCRNRVCCNPAHLEAVTPRVNTLRSSGPAAIHAAKTHCVNGHPFDEANTGSRVRGGRRVCRSCDTRRQREYKARKKLAVA